MNLNLKLTKSQIEKGGLVDKNIDRLNKTPNATLSDNVYRGLNAAISEIYTKLFGKEAEKIVLELGSSKKPKNFIIKLNSYSYLEKKDDTIKVHSLIVNKNLLESLDSFKSFKNLIEVLTSIYARRFGFSFYNKEGAISSNGEIILKHLGINLDAKNIESLGIKDSKIIFDIFKNIKTQLRVIESKNKDSKKEGHISYNCPECENSRITGNKSTRCLCYHCSNKLGRLVALIPVKPELQVELGYELHNFNKKES